MRISKSYNYVMGFATNYKLTNKIIECVMNNLKNRCF